MTILTVLTVAAGLVVSRPPAPKPHASPCYATFTIVVSDSSPYRIRRVITSGVREFEDAGGGTPGACRPLDNGFLAKTRQRMEATLDSADRRAHVERIAIAGTESAVAGDYLVRLRDNGAQRAKSFRGLEVVDVKLDNGGEPRELPLPSSASADQRSACEEKNAALKRSGASFHWSC